MIIQILEHEKNNLFDNAIKCTFLRFKINLTAVDY